MQCCLTCSGSRVPLSSVSSLSLLLLSRSNRLTSRRLGAGVIKFWGPPAPFHRDIGASFVHLGSPLALTVYRPAKCNKTKSTTVDVLIDFKPGPLRRLVPRTVAARTAKSARKHLSGSLGP